MTADIRHAIAMHIRHGDGDNQMDSHRLGLEVAALIGYRKGLDSAELTRFITHTNQDKTMGAAALADAIVDAFGLEEAEVPS